jgi:hypothetical protein
MIIPPAIEDNNDNNNISSSLAASAASVKPKPPNTFVILRDVGISASNCNTQKSKRKRIAKCIWHIAVSIKLDNYTEVLCGKAICTSVTTPDFNIISTPELIDAAAKEEEPFSEFKFCAQCLLQFYDLLLPPLRWAIEEGEILSEK